MICFRSFQLPSVSNGSYQKMRRVPTFTRLKSKFRLASATLNSWEPWKSEDMILPGTAMRNRKIR